MPAASLRVLSFNIRGSFVKDGDNEWPKRAALNVATIKALDPDLIGFQEMQTGNLETYARELPGYAVIRGPQYNNRDPFCYTSIAYKPDVLAVRDTVEFWLSETPDVWSGSWETACWRAALVADFTHKASGVTLRHLNTHLDHISETARVNGSRLIVKKLATTPSDAGAVLVTGDFNCDPGSEAYRAYAEAGYRDSFLEAGETDGPEAYTFTAFKNQRHPDYGRIDWILLRDGAGSVKARAAGIDKTVALPQFPSDHFPIWADVVLES